MELIKTKSLQGPIVVVVVLVVFPSIWCISFSMSSKVSLIDPLWDQTWHINGPSGMRVTEAWRLGFSGRGVNVVNVDSGIEHTHGDLFLSYDPSISTDLVDNDRNPYVNTEEESHGTKMAGLIASRPNNSMCSTGIAYDVNLGHIRALKKGKPLDDETEAAAFSFAQEQIDIYVLGYGSSDLGVGNLRPKTLKALRDGIEKGRGGKGSLFLTPGGNSGVSQKSCSLDNRINSMYTMAINAMGASGSKPYYGESCAGILASAYSSGRYPDPYMVTTSVNNSCTASFSGTSSSVSVAGGLLALALQANLRLTWRDMQHLIVVSCRQDHQELAVEGKWITNAAGLKFSPSFGFGLLDALQLVQNALRWSPVGDQERCVVPRDLEELFSSSLIVHVGERKRAGFSVSAENCAIRSVEHVLLVVNMTAYLRGDIMATLTSPSDTKVSMLEATRYDISWDGFEDQSILSLATWGENPVGAWTLDLEHGENLDSSPSRPFSLLGARLEIYGTTKASSSSSLMPLPHQSPTAATTTTTTSS